MMKRSVFSAERSLLRAFLRIIIGVTRPNALTTEMRRVVVLGKT